MEHYKKFIAGFIALICLITFSLVPFGWGVPNIENKHIKRRYSAQSNPYGEDYQQAVNQYEVKEGLRRKLARTKKRRADSLKRLRNNVSGGYSHNNSSSYSKYGNSNEYEYEEYYTTSGVKKRRRVRRRNPNRNRNSSSGSGNGYTSRRSYSSSGSKAGSFRGSTGRSFRGGSRRGGK